MSVSNIADCLAENVRFTKQLKLGINVQLLTAQKVLSVDDPQLQVLDPDGATEDVLLPPEAESVGLFFVILNSGTTGQILVVKEDGDSTTIMTITEPEQGIVFCDGITWRGWLGVQT